MKNLIIALMFIFSSSLMAQSSFGIKAGLNYADNGKVEYSDLNNISQTFEAKAERKMGYHFGIFYRADLGRFYLKPELLYSSTKSSYEYNNDEAEYNISSLKLPVLLGVKIIGPVHVFAGPSFQYITSNDFKDMTLEELENEFTIGAQFGAGVKFGGVGIDVRYDQALSEEQVQFVGYEGGGERLDSRPNQFIVSLSLDL
ncbi:MAG TPA: outer membrane beta-barrel protein [Salinimicrobium sp.]|nr:outer membrane beta-barrel protein [Salinimicrobium sp.]